MHQLEVEADLNNATDLFAGVSVSKDAKEKPIEEVKPKTRVEYDAYAKRLAAIILANSVRLTDERAISFCGFTQTFHLHYRKAPTTVPSLTFWCARLPSLARTLTFARQHHP
ncbi:hypothetical protein BX666DRAFT_1987981 [Dichotomocladium elegans]|nr:hypothetical protein BX666DRAFT_1987981 [Dichotomocladium elegans]